MADITVGNKTLTIPSARVDECAAIIKKWCSLEGDTPAEILTAWSDHIIDEVKRVLIDRIGDEAYNESMEDAQAGAEAERELAETQADTDLEIS